LILTVLLTVQDPYKKYYCETIRASMHTFKYLNIRISKLD